MQKIKLVIFDLWKTLAFRDVNYSTTSKMVEDLGLPINKNNFKELFEQTMQTRLWEDEVNGYKKLCNLVGTDLSNAKKMQRIRYAAELKSKLYPDSLNLLKDLKAQGLKLGLITNSTKSSIEHISKTGLLDYLDYKILSYEVGTIKPEIQTYNKILELSQCLPEECLMIGDDEKNDVLVPQKLGMNAILFDNFDNLRTNLRTYFPKL